jgi:hypothetical protein
MYCPWAQGSPRCSKVPPLSTSVCVSPGMEASSAAFAALAPTAQAAQQQTASPVVGWAPLPVKVPPAPLNAAANLALVAPTAL